MSLDEGEVDEVVDMVVVMKNGTIEEVVGMMIEEVVGAQMGPEGETEAEVALLLQGEVAVLCVKVLLSVVLRLNSGIVKERNAIVKLPQLVHPGLRPEILQPSTTIRGSVVVCVAKLSKLFEGRISISSSLSSFAMQAFTPGKHTGQCRVFVGLLT